MERVIPLQIQNIIQNMTTYSLNQYKSEIDKQISSLNSRYFKTQKRELLKILSKDDTTSIVKLKILDFFLDKLYNIIRPDDIFEEKIQKNLCDFVFSSVDLAMSLRLRYLRFKNEKVCFNSSIDLFCRNIRNIFPEIPYFQILKYILRSSFIKEERLNEILNELEEIFLNRNVSLFTKMEIADIFILNEREERGYEMLNIIREEQRRRAGLPINIYKEQKTIYEDTQNVHNKKINESVLQAGCKLIEIYGKTDFDEKEIIEELIKISPTNKQVFINVLERVQIDTSIFKYEDNSFSMYIVFANLWVFIQKHTQSNDLKIRLIEEMIDMEMYCSTGHLSRFINVIQGFTEVEELCVRISNKSQIKAVVSRLIETLLSNAPDNVLDAMIEEDQTPFTYFVRDHINKNIQKIINEYGNEDKEIMEHILSSVISYTKCDIFRIENDVLIVKTKEEIMEEKRIEEKRKKIKEEQDKIRKIYKIAMSQIRNYYK